MTAERYVVFGLAQPRSPWFSEVARWANAGSIPVDYVKCMSAEEARARIDTGRSVSALLVDAARMTADRDLVDCARDGDAVLIVVDDGRVARDWRSLGAATVLRPDFGRDELIDALGNHASPIGRIEHSVIEADAIDRRPRPEASWRGHVVAVTGPGGTGASTVAMALAQALGADPRHRGLVLLADLSLHAELAMLHDARDVVPGLQELVEACRGGSVERVHDLVFHVSDRRYDVLLGLRRHRDWTAIRPRSFDLALDTLRRHYRLVVADVDADLEGEHDTGSVDVAERNHIARSTITQADVVLVVGQPGTKGMHALVRTMHELVAAGVDDVRCIPVLNRVGRSPRQRAELAATFAGLRGASDQRVAAPAFVPERRHLDDGVAQAAPLPAALCQPLGRLVTAALSRIPPRGTPSDEPIAVVPGSLGSWPEPEGGNA